MPDNQAAKAASHVRAHEHSRLRRATSPFQVPSAGNQAASNQHPTICMQQACRLTSPGHPFAHSCSHEQPQTTTVPPCTHTHTHTYACTTTHPHTLPHLGADHRAPRFSTPIVGCAVFVWFLRPLLGAGGGMGKRVTCSWYQLLRCKPIANNKTASAHQVATASACRVVRMLLKTCAAHKRSAKNQF